MSMIKVYEKFVVVEGCGNFPLDMLRYDSAFPATEHDAAIAQNYQDKRSVALVLRTKNKLAPTERRWQSFLWPVVGVFIEKYQAEEARRDRQYAIEAERLKEQGALLARGTK